MCKFFKNLIKVLVITVAALFVVYFWNLDLTLLGWLYEQVRRRVDGMPVVTKISS